MRDHPTATAATILVIDNHPNRLHWLLQILTERGYRVRSLCDGNSALESARAQPPDLILLGLLTSPDAWEVCSSLKANASTYHIPILFINSSQATFDRGKVFAVGGADYLTEPFELAEVLTRIANHLQLSQLSKPPARHEHQNPPQTDSDRTWLKSWQESERKYQVLVESATDAFFLINPTTNLIFDCNQQAVELFEAKGKDELINIEGHTLHSQLYPREQVNANLEAIEREGWWSGEVQYTTKQGKQFWGQVVAKSIQLEGQKCYLVRIADITERRQREDALQLMMQGMTTKVGYEFFRACVCHLAQFLQVRYCLLTKYTDRTQTTLRTLACWQGYTWSQNFDFKAIDTPWEAMFMGIGSYYPKDLQDMFPNLAIWKQLNAQSFLSLPLMNAEGMTIGHLAILDVKPMMPKESKTAEMILQIFADRASAELQRQEVAEALAESEKRLSAIVATNADALIVVDYQGIVRFFNPSSCRLFGREPEALMGSSFGLPITLDRTTEIEVLHPQRGIMTAEMRIADIVWDGIPAYLASLRDISDRKRAEIALRESQERLQLALEGSALGLWDWNLPTGTTYFDAQWKRMLGYEAEEVENSFSTWEALVYPEDLPGTRQKLQAYLEGQTSIYEVEFRMLSKSGEWKWIQSRGQIFEYDWMGQPVRMAGTHKDIHAYKQSELELRLVTERLQYLLAANPGIIFSSQCSDCFKTTYISENVTPILGYKSDEIIGDRNFWFSRIHSEDIERVLKQITRLFEQGYSSHEYRFLHQNGNYRWLYVQLRLVSDSTGNPAEILGYILDISDRKQAEETLQQALFVTDLANRAKSEFFASMSHELRTPLNAILGFTQLMLRDTNLNKQQLENLQIVNHAGEHLLELINSILEISKIEAGKTALNITSFDLLNQLFTLEKMLQLKARAEGLTLKFEIAKDVPQYIKTDEGKLRQVLLNILGNAIKFTEKGTVTLRVRKKESSPFNRSMAGETPQLLAKVNLPSSPENSDRASEPSCWLHFEIEDTGPGIPPEDIELLFEAFVPKSVTKKIQKGTGLGLPISRKFVQLMGGDIQVRSTLRQGSLFSFDIELTLAKATEIKVSELKTNNIIGLANNQPKYRILVVEDRLENRSLMMRLLTSVGFEVQEAENGLQAIQIWEKWEPHLIWMDMLMPVVDGYEATKWIKTHLKGQATVIIALIASNFEEDRSLVMSAGCDDFVRKPFPDEVIFEKMAKHLGVHYVYQEKDSSSDLQRVLERVTVQEVLTPETLALLPQSWIDQLYKAATELDETRILNLIDQISVDYPSVALALIELVDSFRLDLIVNLTQPFLGN